MSASPLQATVHRVAVPAPQGSEPRNAWLIAGPPVTLVDPGPSTAAAYAAVRDAMAGRGSSIRDIERVVLTHAHGGHAGLTARIHLDGGARVYAHAAALPALVDPRGAAESRVELSHRAALAAGMPADVAASTSARWRDRLAGELAAGPLEVPSAACAALADGEPLDANAREPELGRSWIVHHTGGHSEDHLVLVHAALAQAITGDLIDRRRATLSAVVPTGPGAHRVSQLARLMEAWRSLARRGLPLWLPGHGEPVRAPRVLVARRLAEARLELQAVRRVLSNVPLTAWEVAARSGRGAGIAEAGRRVAETIALLDWLVERGQAHRTATGGAWRFTRTSRRRTPS